MIFVSFENLRKSVEHHQLFCHLLRNSVYNANFGKIFIMKMSWSEKKISKNTTQNIYAFLVTDHRLTDRRHK